MRINSPGLVGAAGSPRRHGRPECGLDAFRARPFAHACCLVLLLLSTPGCAGRRTAAATANVRTERVAAIADTVRHDLDAVCPPEPCMPAVGEGLLRTPAPLTVSDGQGPLAFRDLTLEEARQLALQGPVLRDLGGQLLASPGSVPTAYDPEIQKHDPFYGLPAALSAFDRSYAMQYFYDRTDRAFNNQTVGGGAFELQQDLLTAQARTSRRSITGTEYAFQGTTFYDENNRNGNIFPNTWEMIGEASVRKPLLRGAGVPFNSIAGPNATPGFNFGNGIVIAKLNDSISEADFELAVRNHLLSVEATYWQLFNAYRDWELRCAARDSVEQIYRMVRAKYDSKIPGGEADQEAQVRYQWLLDQELANETFNGSDRIAGVLETERKLRRLLGLPSTETQLLRPSDAPSSAPVVYEWECLLERALMQRPELRRQALRVRQQELRLVAARNFLLPRVDLVGAYRVRGLGDDLLGDGPRFSSAGQDLASFDHQEWRMGMEMDFPSGFRQGHAAVQHARLQLMREESVLQAQRSQVTHELSDAVGRVAQQRQTLTILQARVEAAEHRLAAAQSQYEVRQTTLDLLLEAQEQAFAARREMQYAIATYAQNLARVEVAAGSYLTNLQCSLN